MNTRLSRDSYMYIENSNIPFLEMRQRTPCRCIAVNSATLEPLVGLHWSPALLWLPSVLSPSLNLLISAQACAQRNVYPGWSGEAEALGHLDEVELVHVKDRAQTV